MGEDLIAKAKSIRYGDVTDFSSFGGALIDQRAFNRNADAIERANAIPSLTIVAGGGADDREGYFVAPTILLGTIRPTTLSARSISDRSWPSTSTTTPCQVR